MLIDLFYPQKQPKPEGVSFVQNLMGHRNDATTPEQRAEQKRILMREYSKQWRKRK